MYVGSMHFRAVIANTSDTGTTRQPMGRASLVKSFLSSSLLVPVSKDDFLYVILVFIGRVEDLQGCLSVQIVVMVIFLILD